MAKTNKWAPYRWRKETKTTWIGRAECGIEAMIELRNGVYEWSVYACQECAAYASDQADTLSDAKHGVLGAG